MAYELYYLIGGVLLFIILVGLVIKIIKQRRRNKVNPNIIAQEILNKLDELEKEFERRKQQDERTSPYQVLWEDARGSKFRRSEQVEGTEPAVSNRQLHEQPSGRQDIQSLPNPGNKELNKSNRQLNRNHRRYILSRFRRRRGTAI